MREAHIIPELEASVRKEIYEVLRPKAMSKVRKGCFIFDTEKRWMRTKPYYMTATSC